MAILLIIVAAFLALRSVAKMVLRERVAEAAPDLLEALIALRGNLNVANRANSPYGRELLDHADRAIYKALGIKA